ncbi:acyl-CoA dehydrogenase family protein [Mycolicibacterium sp. Dal123E01]|uniref:acyl-CoA dehydrogenase family protein n=1 Tax=Mycolicibacterium sp. Dal123E01 TaxID=3457578 RepID=UPI00403EAE29
MDFSRVELACEDEEFQSELRAHLTDLMTEDVILHDRETGENFHEGLHLALADLGYLARDFNTEADGGFNALQRRIFELEIGRVHAPWFHWPTTMMVAKTLVKFADPDLLAELMPEVLAGRTRLCLGYTEPEGGSDVATVKTKAARDGDAWIINGAKMFTSNAHNAQYVFLITNSDPEAPKHKNLTMFLVPMDSAGVEVQGIRTVDGDRTNITYYSDVRVDDKYRIGEVNGGWAVLRDALNSEHGTVDRNTEGLEKLATMTEHILLTAEAVDGVAAVAQVDDDSVAYRLGRAAARLEAALSAPAMSGRVLIAQTMRDITPDLMDILGAAASLPVDTKGAADNGGAEYIFRLASPVGIYGGTLEVFRNMIAQQILGLGRPAYAPPVKAR